MRRFWNDPRDQFILDTIWEWVGDADYIAQQAIAEGALTHSDVRVLFDAELPHAHWGGLRITTYATGKPEIRGLLLALELGRAEGRVVPRLFVDFLGWMAEQGWNEFGQSHAVANGA